jgi:hypothetical protein
MLSGRVSADEHGGFEAGEAASLASPMIVKDFGSAKTFRSHRANFLHRAKSLHDNQTEMLLMRSAWLVVFGEALRCRLGSTAGCWRGPERPRGGGTDGQGEADVADGVQESFRTGWEDPFRCQ